MKQRTNWKVIAPDGYVAQRGLEAYARRSGLESTLLELVKTRASQINRCADCLDMHTKDARAHGESEQRLNALAARREAPFYSDRERAALAWTEAVTRIAENGADDETYAKARRHFGEKALVDLTLAIVAINGWNRLAVAFRAPAGSYQPGASTALAGPNRGGSS
jgi:AhpD family alkylhydroperoxidase